MILETLYSNATYDEETLLYLISDGDEQSFAELFHIYYPKLRPFVARFFKNEHQIDDVLQEAFIKVWLNRDKLPEIKNVGAWIRTIVSRICLNAIRDELTKNENIDTYSQMHTSVETPADRAHASEMKRIVSEAVNHMPPARKQIFRLSREAGLKPAEIAEKLSLSVSTVKNVLVIALKEIRKQLADNGIIVSLFYFSFLFFRK